MRTTSKSNSECYFPPILGNGEISLAPDAEGTMNYTAASYAKRGISAFDGIIVRCARRTNNNKRLRDSKLFSFGKLLFGSCSELKEWSQQLEEERGLVSSKCEYQDGSVIDTMAFIHPKMNIYAVNKTFHKVNSAEVFYDFILEGFNEATDELTNILYTECSEADVKIGFKLYGMNVYIGEIRLSSDKSFSSEPIKNGVRMKFSVTAGESFSLYYYLEDNLECKDFHAALDEMKSHITKEGFYGLLDECERNFREYFDLGYVKTGDSEVDEIYRTALYCLKCYTTKYSVPIGLNNGYWNGRYFAFDEYYNFYGLLTSGRTELAKRVPSFRLDVCLETALNAGMDCHRNEKSEEAAKFLWETGEKSDVELSPIGPWLDHVFHMCVVGLGAYEYYEFTLDRDFLSRCYRMIRACAKFFSIWMIYETEDTAFIGKCMDLERLGAGAENAFMTACGAIKLLRVCADASEILGIDEDYRRECRRVAEKLLKNLPERNGMYVPLLKTEQKSIAVFSAKYPFDVLPSEDKKMLASWHDFEENGSAYGNMYAMGRKISSWYACWKAEAYARINDSENAYRALKQACESKGVFNELFEINEPGIRIKPWFTTAHGMFLSSVNEMLVQSSGKKVKILPAFPLISGNAEFKLPIKGSAIIEVKIKNKRLDFVRITRDGDDVTFEYEIEFSAE